MDISSGEKYLTFLGNKMTDFSGIMEKIKSGGLKNTFKEMFTSTNSKQFGESLQKDSKIIDEYLTLKNAADGLAGSKEKLSPEKVAAANAAAEESLKGASASAQEYARSTDAAAASGKGFEEAQLKIASVGTKLKGVLLGLTATMASMAIVAGVTFLVKKGADALDDYIHRSERLAETADDLKTAADEASADVEDLKNQIDEVKNSIDEINNGENITVTDAAELKRLDALNTKLENQLAIKTELARIESEKAEKAAMDVVKEKVQYSKLTESGTGDADPYNQYDFQMTEGTRIEAIKANIENVRRVNEQLVRLNKERSEAFKTGDYSDKTYDSDGMYESVIRELTDDANYYKDAALTMQDVLNTQAEALNDSTPEATKYKEEIETSSAALVELTKEMDESTGATDATAAATQAASDALATLKANYDKVAEAGAGTTREMAAVNSALNNQNTGVGMDTDTLAALIEMNADYAKCVEYNNGVMTLNTEKAQALAKADAELRLAELAEQDAAAKEKYSENAKKISLLKAMVTSTDDAYTSQIQTLEEQNDVLAQSSAQYETLAAQIRQTTGTYQAWLDAQNAPMEGDMFKDAQAAYKYINDVLNDASTDDYMKTGTEKYKSALGFVIPDSIDADDKAAVRKYLKQVADYMNKDGSISASNVISRMKNAGVFDIDEAGNYTAKAGLSIEDLNEALGTTSDVTRSILGMLKDYDIDIDVSDGEDSLSDLESKADELGKKLAEGMGVSGIDLDVGDDIGKIDDAIAKLKAIKDEANNPYGTGIYSEDELDTVNTALELCIMKKQELEKPAIMNVKVADMDDSSLKTAIGLLQQFQTLANEREMDIQLGIDTTDVDTKLADVQAEIGEIDSTTKTSLELDTTDTASIQASIDNLTAEKIISIGVDSTAIDGYTPEDKQAKVVYLPDTLAIDILNFDKDATIRYHALINESASRYAASSNGKAGAAGTRGEQVGGRMLVGELGREMYVDPASGTWKTVGDNGAEFIDVPRGGIIFSHEKTEALLDRGWVNARGMARAKGTDGASINAAPGYGNKDTVTIKANSELINGIHKAAKATQALKKATDELTDAEKKQNEEASKTQNILKIIGQAMIDELDNRIDKLNEDIDELNEQVEKNENRLKIWGEVMQKVCEENIDRLGDEVDALQEGIDKRQNSLSLYANAAQKIIEDRIEGINDERDAASKASDAEIEELEKQKQAIQDKADEEDRELTIQKLKDAYAKAANSKTQRVYKEGQGFTWQRDEEAVQGAEDDLNEQLRQNEQDDAIKALDDKIDKINEARDVAEEAWDAEIEKLDELQEKYSETAELIGTSVEDYEEKMQYQAEISALTNEQMMADTDAYMQKVMASVYDPDVGTIAAKQAEIDQWTALKESISEQVENIGMSVEDYQLTMDAARQFTTQSLAEMGGSVNSYTNDVYNSIYDPAKGIIQAKEAEIKELEKVKAEYQKQVSLIGTSLSDYQVQQQAAAFAAGSSLSSMKGYYSSFAGSVVSNMGSVARATDDAKAALERYRSVLASGGSDGGNYTAHYASGTSRVGTAGTYNVDDGAPEIVVRPSSGRYTTLEVGDGVIRGGLTNTLFSAAVNPEKFVRSSIDGIIGRNSVVSEHGDVRSIKVDVGDIVMSGVNDVDGFSKVIKKNVGNVFLQVFNERE